MAQTTLIVSVRWPLSSLAETVTSDHASAACYRRAEHVGIECDLWGRGVNEAVDI
jgi:hypothetical protein